MYGWFIDVEADLGKARACDSGIIPMEFFLLDNIIIICHNISIGMLDGYLAQRFCIFLYDLYSNNIRS